MNKDTLNPAIHEDAVEVIWDVRMRPVQEPKQSTPYLCVYLSIVAWAGRLYLRTPAASS
jgi:hypothetical protein